MPDKPQKQRKTFAQMEAEHGGNPWACPRCGCVGPHKVVDSYEAGGERRRRRVCRNCNQLIRTAEVPVPDGKKLKVVSKDDEIEEEAAA